MSLAELLAHADRAALAPGGLSVLAVIHEQRPRAVEPFRPVKKASLPRLHRAHRREIVTLPGFALGTPAQVSSTQSADAWLPEFEPAATHCPSWLVELFDRAGGTATTPGHGAPWDMRLWIAALCSVPVDARTGAAAVMPFRVQDVVDWLHLDGWSNRRRDWHRLPEALDRLGSLRVTLDGELVALVHALAIPRRWDPDAWIRLQVRVPRSAAAGARLDLGPAAALRSAVRVALSRLLGRVGCAGRLGAQRYAYHPPDRRTGAARRRRAETPQKREYRPGGEQVRVEPVCPVCADMDRC